MPLERAGQSGGPARAHAYVARLNRRQSRHNVLGSMRRFGQTPYGPSTPPMLRPVARLDFPRPPIAATFGPGTSFQCSTHTPPLLGVKSRTQSRCWTPPLSRLYRAPGKQECRMSDTEIIPVIDLGPHLASTPAQLIAITPTT